MSKEANQSKRRYFPLRDASNPYKVTLVEITEAPISIQAVTTRS